MPNKLFDILRNSKISTPEKCMLIQRAIEVEDASWYEEESETNTPAIHVAIADASEELFLCLFDNYLKNKWPIDIAAMQGAVSVVFMKCN